MRKPLTPCPVCQCFALAGAALREGRTADAVILLGMCRWFRRQAGMFRVLPG